MCKDCGCGSGGTGYRINGKTPAELHGHDHPHDHDHHHDHDHPHDHPHSHDHDHHHDHGHHHDHPHVHEAPLGAVHQPGVDGDRVIRIERDILSKNNDAARQNRARLAATGTTLEQVRTSISNSNAQGALGVFEGVKRAVTIGINDQLRDAPDYDPIVVKTVNGDVIRLADVASIRPSVRNTRSAGWYNRDPSVLLVITKQADANVIDTVDRIKAQLPRLAAGIPPAITIHTVLDRTTTIRASVRDEITVQRLRQSFAQSRISVSEGEVDAALKQQATVGNQYHLAHILIALPDGSLTEGDGWTIRTVLTPGHAANHAAFALEGTGILFSADHVMAWSTSIVAPPDGAMSDYMASLDRLIERGDRLLLPGHGGPVTAPRTFMRGLKTHRRMRERAILERLKAGDRTIRAIVEAIYRDTDPRLHGAAGLSVLAHLEDLVARGAVRSEGAPSLDGIFFPAY